MALVPIPGFAGSSYLSRAKGISSARTVNLRIEKTQDPSGTPLAPVLISKAPYVMYPRSGKKLFATLPTGPINGAWSNGFRTFWVSGGVLYEVFSDGTSKAFGNIPTGTNPAMMRANGNQLLITSAGKALLATGTDIFQPIINFASGMVSVNGINVQWLSGDKFINGGAGDVAQGDYFMLGTKRYIVTSVSDDSNLTINEDGGSFGQIAYQAGDELLELATCEFIDGYFIGNVPNTKTFRISNLEDGSKWDALDVATKNGTVDNIARVINFFGQLGLLGDNNSSEVWGDSGNVDFPFARISGASIAMGTAAAWSAAPLPDGSICWLMSADAGRNQVVRSTGGLPQRISDHAFETAMGKFPATFDAIGSTYIENGHWFYRLDFPTANATWEYDATTGTWVEIGIETNQDEVYAADHGRFPVQVTWPSGKQMNLAGDYASGKIWEIDPSFTTDDGVDIPVLRVAPHVNSYLQRMAVNQFALDCELGTIDPTALGPDGKLLIPTVQLYYSIDGGNTWADAGAGSLGRAGEYEGTIVYPPEQFDTTPNSQTQPQAFEPWPRWHSLGSFIIAMTFKVKSNARMLRAIHNGLVDLSPDGK